VESSGRERLMMDGKAGKAVRSKIHSPEACGVNSAVWVQDRAGHEGQGCSPRLEHPVNCSWVSAPDVRYCRIKTTPCVEKNQTAGLSLSDSEWSSLGEMSSGLYRRGQAMGEGERVWSLIICDHQMEQVNMPGQLSNWKFLSFVCRETRRETIRGVWQAVINQGIWFWC
jgi:hypothetical protein